MGMKKIKEIYLLVTWFVVLSVYSFAALISELSDYSKPLNSTYIDLATLVYKYVGPIITLALLIYTIYWFFTTGKTGKKRLKESFVIIILG